VTHHSPTRLLLLLISLSLVPYLWLLGQIQIFGAPLLVIGNVLGLVGSTLFVWQAILGMRFVLRRLSLDWLGTSALHQKICKYATVFILAHPVLQLAAREESLDFLYTIDLSGDEHVSYGRLAILLFLTIWVTSTFLRKKALSYRYWHYLHYLTYPMMGLIYLHAPAIGTFLNSNTFIRTYWHFWMGLYLVLVFWRVLRFFNIIGNQRYRLIAKTGLPGGITRYTFSPQSRQLNPKPGQFMYLRKSFFSEGHPFSVMEYDPATGQITFGIKAVGKYTNQLQSLEIGDTSYLDGPWGIFTREGQNSDPKVFIAGGIGITPFVELIKRFANKETYLLYSNRTLDIAVNREEFARQLQENYLDVISDDPNVQPPVVAGRIDKPVLQKVLPAKVFTTSRFFLCGPPPFMAAVAKSLMELGVNKEKIYTEEFSL
jgi:predicted ferric reductase